MAKRKCGFISTYRDDLEVSANLLVGDADILDNEDKKKGMFIKSVRIPTNGQSCSQKQHPVAKALEADVDAEIIRMTTERNDSKGFNSQAVAVHKKNGKNQCCPQLQDNL